MSQLSSVERTTMIELFSTFFDRLSSNNSQRDLMLKQLYQFKTLLYANEPQSVEKFLSDIQSNINKSPLKRDNSQTKKSSSVKPRSKYGNNENHEGEIDQDGKSIFQDFKSKNQHLFRAIQQIDHDEFFKIVSQLDDQMMTSLGKQRCQSSTGELFKDPMNHSRMTEDRVNQIQQIIRKCLRCNKDIPNHESKSISYFCNSCKNC